MPTEIKTGFWQSGDMEYSMKSVTFEDLCGYGTMTRVNNAWLLLYGGCLRFALALHKAFGYEIRIAWNAPFADRAENIWDLPATIRGPVPETFWDHLVHGYCVAESQGRTVYIDARGMTTDPQPFFDAFAKRFQPGCFEEPGIPPEKLEKFLRTAEETEEYLLLSEKLIASRKSDYALF